MLGVFVLKIGFKFSLDFYINSLYSFFKYHDFWIIVKKKMTYFSWSLHDVDLLVHATDHCYRDIHAFTDERNVLGQVSVSLGTCSWHGQILQPVDASRVYQCILYSFRADSRRRPIHTLRSACLRVVQMYKVSNKAVILKESLNTIIFQAEIILLSNRYNIEKIRGSEYLLPNPNIADDEAYHTIINCIKLYKRILKLVSTSFKYVFAQFKNENYVKIFIKYL